MLHHFSNFALPQKLIFSKEALLPAGKKAIQEKTGEEIYYII